ncbi:MAG: hypothetical protein J7485_04455 [Sphingobium sp.]|nr:hypothetical protein [Sphingobium sp.]
MSLPTVTLCAVSSVNVAATVVALERCLDAVDFAECLLFTDLPIVPAHPSIQVVRIARLASAEAYSLFMQRDLASRTKTNHILVVQWDGFVLDPLAWQDEFLDYDYIGASWPQFTTGGQVGNGGFSLRSRRLLEACLDPDFKASHPEDVAICRQNRSLLIDRHAIRFADLSVAERFSYERTPRGSASFGFHGVFNMPDAVGRDAFWRTYQLLDDRRTIRTDFRALLLSMLLGRDGLRRAGRMLCDRLLSR